MPGRRRPPLPRSRGPKSGGSSRSSNTGVPGSAKAKAGSGSARAGKPKSSARRGKKSGSRGSKGRRPSSKTLARRRASRGIYDSATRRQLELGTKFVVDEFWFKPPGAAKKVPRGTSSAVAESGNISLSISGLSTPRSESLALSSRTPSDGGSVSGASQLDDEDSYLATDLATSRSSPVFDSNAGSRDFEVSLEDLGVGEDPTLGSVMPVTIAGASGSMSARDSPPSRLKPSATSATRKGPANQPRRRVRVPRVAMIRPADKTGPGKTPARAIAGIETWNPTLRGPNAGERNDPLRKELSRSPAGPSVPMTIVSIGPSLLSVDTSAPQAEVLGRSSQVAGSPVASSPVSGATRAMRAKKGSGGSTSPKAKAAILSKLLKSARVVSPRGREKNAARRTQNGNVRARVPKAYVASALASAGMRMESGAMAQLSSAVNVMRIDRSAKPTPPRDVSSPSRKIPRIKRSAGALAGRRIRSIEAAVEAVRSQNRSDRMRAWPTDLRVYSAAGDVARLGGAPHRTYVSQSILDGARPVRKDGQGDRAPQSAVLIQKSPGSRVSPARSRPKANLSPRRGSGFADSKRARVARTKRPKKRSRTTVGSTLKSKGRAKATSRSVGRTQRTALAPTCRKIPPLTTSRKPRARSAGSVRKVKR